MDNHIICCMFNSYVNCHTPKRVYRFFDCGSLVSPPLLAVFSSFLCFMVFLFNSIVLYSRSRHVFYGKESKKPDAFRVQSLLIWNLGLSGFLMSCYMFSILYANYEFGKLYYLKSKEWVNSAQCIMSGFLYFCSLESSILFLVFLSVDQYIKFRYVETGKRITFRVAVYGSTGVWGFACFTGLLGALSLPSNSDFHDLSRLCIGLPIFWRPGGLEVRDNTINPLQLPFGIILVMFNYLCFPPIVYCYTSVNRELNKLYKELEVVEEERRRKRKEEKELRKKKEAEEAAAKDDGIDDTKVTDETGQQHEASGVHINGDVPSQLQDNKQLDSNKGVADETEDKLSTFEVCLGRDVRLLIDSTGLDSKIDGNGETGVKCVASEVITNGHMRSPPQATTQDGDTDGIGDVAGEPGDRSTASEINTNGDIHSESKQDDDAEEDKGEDPEEKILRLAEMVKAILVLSCFIYVPVFQLAMLSQFRAPIPANFYRWVMFFLLPLCSAINPILYLLLSVNYKPQPHPPDMDTSEVARIQYQRQFEIMNMSM